MLKVIVYEWYCVLRICALSFIFNEANASERVKYGRILYVNQGIL